MRGVGGDLSKEEVKTSTVSDIVRITEQFAIWVWKKRKDAFLGFQWFKNFLKEVVKRHCKCSNVSYFKNLGLGIDKGDDRLTFHFTQFENWWGIIYWVDV